MQEDRFIVYVGTYNASQNVVNASKTYRPGSSEDETVTADCSGQEISVEI